MPTFNGGNKTAGNAQSFPPLMPAVFAGETPACSSETPMSSGETIYNKVKVMFKYLFSEYIS